MSAVQIAVPASRLLVGSATAGETATQLTDSKPDQPLFRGVTIANTGAADVFIGLEDVTTETGFPLPAGRDMRFEIDDPTVLYIVSASGSETVSWWAA